jgi:UDP-hydrolysing UDP-N-acetyl-D-glucosamine 2-epimerase
VVLTARASWAKLQSLCQALSLRADVELQIVCCASALLERYGNVSLILEAQGFAITERVYSVFEGATLETTAMEVGALQEALSRTYARLKPDVVVACADRREILAVAGAARMQEIPIAHIQGGELSGSVDDAIRNAVTQLATEHFVCTTRAKHRVYGLTGRWEHIWHVGCGSIDVAREALDTPKVTFAEIGGVGYTFDLTERFVIVLQHPVTSEVEQAAAQMQTTLDATVGQRRIVFWSGQDAGAESMAKVLRMTPDIHTVRNLPPQRFLRLLTQCACLVGNSSCGIRESSWLGIPVVNVGSRQAGRERGPNVIDVPHDVTRIRAAMETQLAHGRYPSSRLYGDGHAGERICDVLLQLPIGSGPKSHPAPRAGSGPALSTTTDTERSLGPEGIPAVRIVSPGN